MPTEIPTISFSIGEVELRHLETSKMVGDYACWNYFQSIDTPENREFVEKFKKKYGPQRVISDPMEAAYNGVKLWATAIAQTRSCRVSEIRESMRHAEISAPQGKIRIDPETQHAFKTARIGRVTENGQFEVIWSAARPQPPRPYPRTRTKDQWNKFVEDLYERWQRQWSAPVPGSEDQTAIKRLSSQQPSDETRDLAALLENA